MWIDMHAQVANQTARYLSIAMYQAMPSTPLDSRNDRRQGGPRYRRTVMLNDVIVAQAIAHQRQTEIARAANDDALRAAREIQSVARQQRRALLKERLTRRRSARERASFGAPTKTIEPQRSV
jgi:hypothetical protein